MGERGMLPPLPLALGPPHLIPPAPTRDLRAIAFLPDLGGLPWVAYAAGSFLIVSHLPSPSRDDTSDGAGDDGCAPFFRQVIDIRAPVSAVAWCGGGSGEVAAAADNSVSIFQPAPAASSPGSFGWLLRWSITETFAVTAVAWTGSGDGIVAVGSGVSMWARAQSSWQLAWRSMPKVPQSLVSTTCFVQGPVATVAAVVPTECSVPALVFLNDAKRGLEQAELVHPQPVCMIQWRPWSLCVSDRSEVRREILMTCCLDGTVRLWSEDELVKSKKQRGLKILFSVIAVIEVNNTLNGALGVDITVRWSMESGSVVSRDEEGNFELFSGDSRESQVGKCEWLVSVGPGPCVNFWALHCLDDVFPPRYPRITLWKQSKLQGWAESYVKLGPPKSLEQSIFVEAVIYRRLCSGPPTTCSLLHLLLDDSFVWSILSNSQLLDSGTHVSSESANGISCCLTKPVKQDGHKGSIRQVSVHPYSCEIELAVSMDSNRMLFFWSLSTFSTLIPTLHAPTYPLWKLLCKFDLRNISEDVQYSCLCWAPSVSHDNRFLVLGGESGADCFIVRIQKEVLSCQKIFTIPFLGERNAEGPPDSIHTIPLASKCSGCFVNNSFLVVCIWRKSFQAFSWKVVLHSENQYDSGRCLCGFAGSSLSTSSQGRHATCFNSGTFSAVVYEGSSVFPSSLEGEYPTCISVVPLNNTVLPIQHDPCGTVPGYHIATGCSGGTVKLWKMSCADSSLQTEKERCIWELVGMYGAHQGPVSMVLLSSCGRVVTACRNLKKNSTAIHIWETVKLIGDGSFLLEEALMLEDRIVGLDGLSLGDGRFLLAVYLPNELRIYSHKHPSIQNVLHNEDSKEEHLWSCIALSHSHHDIAGFFWGPKATITLVHENHLSLFTSWLVTGAEDTQICACPTHGHGMLPCANSFNETTFGKLKVPENDNSGTIGSNSVLPTDQDDSYCSHGLCNLLDIADKLSGPVASYHPRALVQYLCSGEWKRANGALQHLVQSMKASEASKAVSKCSSCTKSCHSIPELPLSEYFVATTSNSISNKGFLWGEDRSNTTFNLLSSSNSFLYMDGNIGINTTTSASKQSEIVELLDKNFTVYGLSDIERTQILVISDLMGEITDQSRSSPYKSLDEAGRRFWIAVQFRQLNALRRSGNSSSNEGFQVDSASIAWAFQSDCQDDLLNSVLPLEPTWPEMQKLGIGLWYTNVSQLRTRMEKLARLQYLKSKDPKDCALLYIALNRIKVLVGLFKISRDERNKRLYESLQKLPERHKAAALKNAYVLMGKHQWELAIAFFLLGDDFSSAVNVCAKNLQDEQLAIVICRLVEGSGGPLERNLISNVLLPNAVEKGDNWLSSLLEWMLGNYFQSINRLFGCHPKLLIDESKILGDANVFSDPEVGQYCVILSTKNGFRNCVGEAVSAKLSKLSFAMTACALNKCGLPLEALECLSTNSGIDGKESINSPAGGDDKIFDGILNPFAASKNWLSSSVISDIESNLKVTMASKYLSRLLRSHLFCSQCNASLSEDKVLNEYNSHQIEELSRDVTAVTSIFDRRFSLKFADIAEKILNFCCHDGLLFLAYVLLWGCRSPDVAIGGHSLECRSLDPINYLLLVSFKESCEFLSRYVVYSSFTCFVLNMEPTYTAACTPKENHKYIIAGLSNYFNASRLLLRHDNDGSNILDNRSDMVMIMDLLEYIIKFSFSWLYRDINALLIMINPVLAASVNGESFQVLLDRLMHTMHQRSHDISGNAEGGMPSASVHKIQLEKNENSNILVDEKWHLIGASLWIQLTSVIQHFLSEFVEKERLENQTGGSDSEFKGHFSPVAAKLAIDSIHFVSSSLVKLHASFLRKSLPTNSHSSVLFWLQSKSSQQWSGSNSYDQLSRISHLANSENMEALFNNLWEISVNPVDICKAFVDEGVNCFSLRSINVTRSWKDIRGTAAECKNNSTQRSGEEHKHGLSSKNNDQRQGFTDEASSNGEVLPETKRKELIVQKDFQSPRELLRRNGELLEAICLNSINEKQAAIATNRKGLVFFNWSEKKHCKKLAEYVWSGSDWPLDGWAGCESTATPTFISSGVGLGRKKGSQLSSGGTTIGLGSLAKPGRDLTGGGAFGIPGYAGIGASGFGWGEPEEFEDFVDPPATLENIHSRALSRHPSLPLFLVGSSNTHVYLWEFGKDSAMATYGVLPAANVPPPYALPSISAVQFDYYGQRFATAALDGTVCTWQVEVGGRSNIHPTESSLCFDSHASDVIYVSASGSVVASAGSNSNGANVVVWDTLSPPTTCQTSIMCHEGGARSISVFDSAAGCGSFSPLVVTGGKSGDVALHDFRFLSTGNSQRNRISTGHGISGGTTMVWHIPKAHLGSVTKVTTIRNTSLFLTGSKDGDVKLWDAKNSQLVFHWPKLHERHTFFQPTSRGFGGVVRAAVSDLQVLPHGFISCGGDGSVKLVELKDDLAAVHQQ